MLLWYSQHARVTGTPSITFVEGPSTHRGGEATLHRLPLARLGHCLFQVSDAVTGVEVRSIATVSRSEHRWLPTPTRRAQLRVTVVGGDVTSLVAQPL